MYAHVGLKDSNTAGNGYQFHCPVVDRDALFIACLFMRTKFMKGQSFAANDCRCAMTGSKCPAVHMLHMEWMKGERLFHDDEPTKHMLPKSVVERIESVVLLPSQTGNYPLTEEQSKRLFDGKLMIGRVQGEIGPEPVPQALPQATRKPRAVKVAVAAKSDDALTGIESGGDMSAAINAALRHSQEAQ